MSYKSFTDEKPMQEASARDHGYEQNLYTWRFSYYHYYVWIHLLSLSITNKSPQDGLCIILTYVQLYKQDRAQAPS